MFPRIFLVMLCSNLNACFCWRTQVSPEMTQDSDIRKVLLFNNRGVNSIYVYEIPQDPVALESHVESIMKTETGLTMVNIRDIKANQVCMVFFWGKSLSETCWRNNDSSKILFTCLIQMHNQHLRWVGADFQPVGTPLASHISFWKNYINKHRLTMDDQGRAGYPMSPTLAKALSAHYKPETSVFLYVAPNETEEESRVKLGKYIDGDTSQILDLRVDLQDNMIYDIIDRAPSMNKFIFAWKEETEWKYTLIQLVNNRFVITNW